MINEQIPEFNETKIAEEGQPKSVFRLNASTMWKTMANIAKSFNRFRTEANQTQAEINSSESAIQGIKQNIDAKNEEITSKKNDIDLKHNEVMTKVIPTEARYNDKTVDDKVRMSQILNMTGAIQ